LESHIIAIAKESFLLFPPLSILAYFSLSAYNPTFSMI
jgi:hypothetical protein